jgi:hypothetical protein
MINFQLADIDKVLPAGGEDGHHVSWFWLTDGMYWLTIGDQTIYEHSEELIASWGEEATKYCDYYIVRFLEDFTSIFGKIRESVPLKFYGLVDNLIQFRENTQKWAEVIDEDGDEVDEDFVDKHEMLISWYLDRRVSAGHLVGGPKLVFVRHNDKIKIHMAYASLSYFIWPTCLSICHLPVPSSPITSNSSRARRALYSSSRCSFRNQFRNSIVTKSCSFMQRA